jgi:FHA domain
MKIRLHVQDGSKAYDAEHAGPSVTVGRNPAGDLVLEQEAPESVVSWDHARIDLSPREATLTDLKSTNGTYRNGAPVSGTVPLWPNDTIRFGQTGPVLSVRVIDLTPTTAPATGANRPRVAAAAAPPVAVAAPAAKRKLATAPVVSETRGIALKAVKELMATQEELRDQQDAHARQRRALVTVTLVALILFLMLGGGLLWHSGKLDRLFTRTGKIEEDVAGLGDQMRQQAQDTAVHFGKIEEEQVAQKAAQDELMKKVDAAAQQVIAAEAAVRGGMENLKKELGASVDDLNRRLAGKPAEKPADDPAAAPVPRAAAAKKGPRVEPGMKMDIILKDRSNFYTGVLLGISGTEVRLQTLEWPGAKPTVLDLKKVGAFQTRDGVYALNESTGNFEPALTYYKLNKSSREFERLDSTSREPSMPEDAKVLGPTQAVAAVWARGPGGEWCVGLPLPVSQSPDSVPAYHLKEVVTAKGVYTYDDKAGDYSFKAHSQLAAEAKEKRDEYWRQVDEKQWQRRKESYQLVTNRLRALAPYYWRRWWWW